MKQQKLKEVAYALIRGGADEDRVMEVVNTLNTFTSEPVVMEEVLGLVAEAARAVEKDIELMAAQEDELEAAINQAPVQLEKPDLLTFRSIRKGARFVYQGSTYKKLDQGSASHYGKTVEFTPDTVVSRIPKYRSRADRWTELCNEARKALDDMQDQVSLVNDAFSNLKDMQSEFEEWRDNLPENLQNSPLGEKLNTICDMDLGVDAESESISDLDGKLGEAEGAEIPLGFGRD